MELEERRRWEPNLVERFLKFDNFQTWIETMKLVEVSHFHQPILSGPNTHSTAMYI